MRKALLLQPLGTQAGTQEDDFCCIRIRNFPHQNAAYESGSDGTRTRDLRRDRSDQEGSEGDQISLFEAE